MQDRFLLGMSVLLWTLFNSCVFIYVFKLMTEFNKSGWWISLFIFSMFISGSMLRYILRGF